MIHKVQKKPKSINGKRMLSKCYYLRYRYGEMLVDKWKSLKVTQKEVADKLADEFRKEWEAEQAGLLPPKTLRDGVKKPLSEHLEDFLTDLKQRQKAGRNDEGLIKYRGRIKRLMKGCGWRTVGNVTADSFILWRNRQTGFAPATLNDYLDAANVFFNALVKMERIPHNPLRSVVKVQERGKEVRKRRALSDAEFARLLAVAPPYRGMVYHLAGRSGLRRQEMGNLRWADVHLTAERPFVAARASTTKNGKEGFVPLMADVREALEKFKPANAQPGELVFQKGIPRADVLRQDLEAAGIAYQDEEGRYVDFHSLRHTWGTFLQVNGVTQREAMELMRHQDERLTSKIYTDTHHLRLFEKVEALPALEKGSHIGSQISGISGKILTKRDINDHENSVSELVESDAVCAVLTPPDTGGKVASPRGFEPRSLE
ncbi:site-specific integrase [Ruficoccus sp. ZRK36]|nr:site-specific integrase [Ruficoccus sp. ZRK36]